METATIDAILDIDPAQTQALVPVEPSVDAELVTTPTPSSLVAVISDEERDAERLETDFEFARGKITELVKKGREACDSAILLAQSGDSPRAYEVVATMLTALVNANKELVALHKGKIDATPEVATGGGSSVDGGRSSINIEKAVFVGRAQDLLREIRAISAPKQDDSPSSS
jgi:hypothetical protein